MVHHGIPTENFGGNCHTYFDNQVTNVELLRKEQSGAVSDIVERINHPFVCVPRLRFSSVLLCLSSLLTVLC